MGPEIQWPHSHVTGDKLIACTLPPRKTIQDTPSEADSRRIELPCAVSSTHHRE
jgi:hypothetical protein